MITKFLYCLVSAIVIGLLTTWMLDYTANWTIRQNVEFAVAWCCGAGFMGGCVLIKTKVIR